MDITEIPATGIGSDATKALILNASRDRAGVTQFGAALCRTNAVTMSFCASSMARLAVVRWASASASGCCIDRKSISVTRKFCRSDGQAAAMAAVKSCADMLLIWSGEYSRAKQFQ